MPYAVFALRLLAIVTPKFYQGIFATLTPVPDEASRYPNPNPSPRYPWRHTSLLTGRGRRTYGERFMAIPRTFRLPVDA